MTTLQFARRLVSMMDRPWLSLPAVVLLGLVAALSEGIGLSLFVPLVQMLDEKSEVHADGVLGVVIDRFNAVPAEDRLAFVIVAIVACILIKNVVFFANRLLWQYNETKLAHDLRVKIFGRVLRSADSSENGFGRTDIANIVVSEVWRVGSALSATLYLLVSALTCLVFLVLMFLISIKLSIITLASLVAIATMTGLVNKHARSYGERTVDANHRFHVRVWESLYALKLIRSFGRESYEQDRYERSSDGIRRNMLTLNVISAIPDPLTEILATVLIAAILLLFARDQENLPQLVAILVIILRIQRPARNIAANRAALEGLKGAVARVLDLLQATERPSIVSGNTPAGRLGEAIRFDNVSFRYAVNGPDVLSNISFSIQAGTATAIVGPSGAGKSTLLDLMLRLRDPTGGRITVDGIALTDINLDDWRNRLAVVSQDSHFFDDSIGANIAYGKLGASAPEIERAARLAQAHDFIVRLPDGYNADIGELGDKLSGGERQRISLARAIIREPDLVLLDEPTNALDSVAERAFRDALLDYAQGRTVVIVAHRLTMTDWVDQIVVINEGRVVEIGSFDDLVQGDGLFSRLYHSQKLQDVSNSEP